MSAVYYLDASAWVKRHFPEPGSAWIQTLFDSQVTLASSVLGYVEVAATLARRSRIAAGFPERQSQLRAEWQQMFQFELSRRIYEHAAAFAWEHKLRGADAVHLAAADQLQKSLAAQSDSLVLVTADLELVTAAQELGLAVVNPAQIT